MKSWITRTLTGMALLVLASAAPAAAQSFIAEVDCGGVFAPGDSVSVTVRLEEQALTSHDLDLLLELSIPGVGTRQRGGPLVLGPNQDVIRTFTLNLPAGAPTGSYQGSITASSDSEISFDTCSFQVQ